MWGIKLFSDTLIPYYVFVSFPLPYSKFWNNRTYGMSSCFSPPPDIVNSSKWVFPASNYWLRTLIL